MREETHDGEVVGLGGETARVEMKKEAGRREGDTHRPHTHPHVLLVVEEKEHEMANLSREGIRRGHRLQRPRRVHVEGCEHREEVADVEDVRQRAATQKKKLRCLRVCGLRESLDGEGGVCTWL